MTRIDKWQIGISIVQTLLMLAAFSGAIYFGIKQQSINENLVSIEQYNHNKYLLLEESKLLSAKKELRMITIEIIDLFPKQYQLPLEKMSRKKRTELVKRMDDLLLQGMDNTLLANNEESLLLWLKAINKLEPYKGLTDNMTFFGDILDGLTPEEQFDKSMIKSMWDAWGAVLQAHSKLGLSLSKMYFELSDKLKKDTVK